MSYKINSSLVEPVMVSDKNSAGNIIQILANLPDFLRKPMMQGRLKDFFAMTDQDRREMIAMALDAAPSIDPEKLAVLAKTWLELISEFDPEKRTILFNLYSRQVLANPGPIQKLNFGPLTDAFRSLSAKQQQAITDSLHETLFALPKRQSIIRLIPEQTLRALRLKN